MGFVRTMLAFAAVVPCAVGVFIGTASGAIVTESYTDRAAFDARLGGAVSVVTFDDVDTGTADPAPFAADRYAASLGIVITGESGQYASPDFGFPDDYPVSSAPNAYAPGPVEDVLGGGNMTVVTFVAGGEPARVAGFGLVFVDPDVASVSGLTVFDADQPLRDLRVPDADKATLFRGIVAVDDATDVPSAVIARVEIDSGTGWPAGSLNDGVPLDDFVFGAPVPVGGTSTTTTVPTATTTTTLPACAPAPRDGCREPIASRRAGLLVRESTEASRDRLTWSWRGAAATKAELGDPPAGMGFLFCLYDARGLVLESSVPGGGTCGRRLCWRSTRTGFRYRDPARRSDGVGRLTLLADVHGASRIVLTSIGPSVPPLGLPYGAPVTTQLLRTDAAGCWTARMTLPRRSGATRFAARSD